jgi:predicted ATP-grasp superfamily ATP-dependent carboligase
MRVESGKVTSLDPQLATLTGGLVVYDALVLNARLRQSLVTIRSLGSRGLHVAALETFDELPAPAFSSRWCEHKTICPAYEGTKDYLTYLEQILDSTGALVLITSSDGTIALIRQHRERLEQQVQIALAKEPALAIAVNKERTLEIARGLGMGVPRTVRVGSVTEVGAALREIGLPVVVKPVESWVGDEQHGARVISLLVTNPDEARRAVEELTRYGGTVLFQQFLSGRREAISFLYARGQMHARFAQWAKRTDPPIGGTSVLRQAIAIPLDTGEQAERLVREIELEGYSEVEFRRDSAGRPYLMEINPRLSASVEIAVHSGIDFPYLLYQWARGEHIDVVKDYRVGGWMRHLGGDVTTTLASVRQRGRPGVTPPAQAILEFCASSFVPIWYDYLDWRDLLPAWKATLGFPQHMLRQTRRSKVVNRMPNFFIVGAARSGTTSLDRYLHQHPEIYMAPKKEVNFYTADHFPSTGPGDDRINRGVIQHKDQYAQLFAGVAGERAIGESSVFYLCYSGTAERIAQAVPDAKIIMVLRDPVERAFSAYMYLVRDGREHLGFVEALSQEEERRQKGFEPMWWYKELGLYYRQVKRYLDVFGTQRVKVLLYDELFADPEAALRDIFTFLGVKDNVVVDTSVRYNIGGVPKSRILYTLLDNFIMEPGVLGKSIKFLVPSGLRSVWANKAKFMLSQSVSIDPEIQAQLSAYFAEDVGKLEDLLQRNLSCWQCQH